MEKGSEFVANLKEIYKLDPMSPELELLVYKETSGFERTYNRPQQDSENSNASELKQFVESVIEGGKMYRPYVWHLTNGYLSFLLKSYEDAHTEYDAAKTLAPGNAYFQEYLSMLQILLKTAEASTIDSGFEESILTDLKSLNSIKEGRLSETANHVKRYVYQLMAQGYVGQEQEVRAAFATSLYDRATGYGSDAVYNNQDSTLISNMLQFVSRTDLSPFEQFMVSNSNYTRPQLIELNGTVLFRLGHLPEALVYFNQCKLATIQRDPFKTYTRDCFECEADTDPISYTKKTLVEKMLKYESQASSEPANAAKYYFLLGNAWYNMTNYGRSWAYLSDSHSSGSPGDTSDPMEQFYSNGKLDTAALVSSYEVADEKDGWYSNMNRRSVYNCSKALSYYQKALATSKDIEFKASCAFMAAKCEENARTIKEPFDGLPIGIHYYYRELYSKYYNTKFYSEIIAECGYLGRYVALREANR